MFSEDEIRVRKELEEELIGIIQKYFKKGIFLPELMGVFINNVIAMSLQGLDPRALKSIMERNLRLEDHGNI